MVKKALNPPVTVLDWKKCDNFSLKTVPKVKTRTAEPDSFEVELEISFSDDSYVLSKIAPVSQPVGSDRIKTFMFMGIEFIFMGMKTFSKKSSNLGHNHRMMATARQIKAPFTEPELGKAVVKALKKPVADAVSPL